MERDPVCGMRVNKEKPAANSLYKKNTYYFCSSGCKAHFDKDPVSFLKEGPKGMLWVAGMFLRGIFKK